MTSNPVETLLSSFFGSGNELTPAELEQSSPELAAWLDNRLLQLREDPASAHILPRRQGGTTRWYGLAHSARQARALEQELEAFVGSAYARVDRQPALDPTDEVDAAVLEFTTGHALTFVVLPGQQAAVRRSLEVLSQLHRIRPVREASLARPLGRLLRDFEMAVASGDESLSDRALGEIEQSGLLSTQNVAFLRVRRLGGLRSFNELLALPELRTLLAIDRPSRVTSELLRAVYATELSSYEAGNDPRGALEHFDNVVLRRFPALYKSRHGLLTPEAVKSFMLHAVAVSPSDRNLRDQLLATPDLSSLDCDYVSAIAALAGLAPEEGRTHEDAASAIRIGQFDAGLLIARDLPASVERAELLIRCGVEINSLEALTTAAAAVSDLPLDLQQSLISSRWYSGPWAQIRAALSDGGGAGEDAATPTSWAAWFERAVAGGPFPNAIQIAERGVVEWSIAAFTGARESEFIGRSLSQATSAEALRLIKDALPHLLQFLDRSEEAALHRDLLDDIALLLLSEDALSAADVQVVVNISATLIESGLSTGRYSQLIGDFRELWDRNAAPSHLDAGLEMLDVLLLFPCPDPNTRDLLFQALLVSFQRWHRRIRADQWAVLSDLADELGARDAVTALIGTQEAGDGAPDDEARLRTALMGKTVAIYTLTEPAALRARDFIAKTFDGARVEISHDHVASDRLRVLAHTSDLFVVATRSAKHAATTFIEAQRPPTLPILYPSGKGSASIIRAIYGHLNSAGG